MCPLVRTPNQCCVDNAIKQLSFDPTLQDVAWQRAQTLLHPSNSRKCSSKSTKTGRITTGCEASAVDILEALGVHLDPWAGSLSPDKHHPKLKISIPVASPGVNDYWPTRTPTLQHVEDDGLCRLSHKNLLLPRIHLNRPTSCEEYLRRCPSSNRIRMLAEIAGCVQYLHSQRIVHGSIRPDALFVDDEGSALLAYSPGITDGESASIQPASEAYLAPELRDSQNIDGLGSNSRPTFSSDAYAFGSLIHWMCTGRHPNESDPSPDDGLSQLGVSANVASAHLLAISAYRLSASTSKPPSMAAISTPLVDPKRALFEQTDFTLKTLVSRCRSQSPNTRPSLLSIGLQLNQIIVRHILPILPSTMNLLGLSSAQQQQRMAPPGIASSLTAAKGAPFSPYSPRRQISYRNRSASSVRSVPDPRQVYPLQNPSSLGVHSTSDSTAHKAASYVDFSRTGGERDGMESRSWREYTQPDSARVATHASTARQVYTEGKHYVDLYGIDTASNQLDDLLSVSTSSSTLPNFSLPTPNSTATPQNRPSSPPTLVYHAASPNIYQQVHSVNDPSSSQYWNATASGLQPPPLLTHQYSVPPPPPLVPSRPVPSSPRPSRSSNTQHPPHSPSPSPSPSPTPSPWVLPFVKHGGLTAGVQQPGRTR